MNINGIRSIIGGNVWTQAALKRAMSRVPDAAWVEYERRCKEAAPAMISERMAALDNWPGEHRWPRRTPSEPMHPFDVLVLVDGPRIVSVWGKSK